MVADTRKIAAILAADIVGYSRLMGADDEGTLRALKIRRTIFNQLVQEFDGREFGSVGDSLMAQFPSVINAVRCAQTIQRTIAAENESLPTDRRMLLRIGVNLGDVIEENGALFGDGVNIAARLQSLAAPGRVLVSGSAYEHVRNKLSACFSFMGARQVKNISEPISCYEITEPVVASFDQHLVVAKEDPKGTPNKRDFESIAVLPFVDLSPGKDQDYFSDGISEELMNLLAKIPDLRVISRSSAFSFKGKGIDIREIGTRLDVACVLEGSVRMSGNRVRITAQLIDARTDTHLWSETYDRTLDDIFAVQDEIAAALVAHFKTSLSGAAPKATGADPNAYALFLQARQFGRMGSKEGWARSNVLYEQALALDPRYAAAWSGLAANYHNEMTYGNRTVEEGTRLVSESVNKALTIDPTFATAHARLGQIAIYHNLAAAARHVEHALVLEPTNIDVIGIAAQVAQRLGRLDQSIALQEYIVARDPMDAFSHACLGYTYRYAGRLDDVIASFKTALALSPTQFGAQYFVGVTLLLMGKLEVALKAIQQESSETWRLLGLAMVYHALGRKIESDNALAELMTNHEQESAYNIAYVLAFRDEADRAFDWLNKAITHDDPGMLGTPFEPLFTNLHDDPRWPPFLLKLGMAPAQLAQIPFNVTEPSR